MAALSPVTLYPDTEALAQGVAEAAAAYIRQCVEQRGVCHIAFSGGSTPRLYLAQLAAQPLPWGTVHGWWADERHVLPRNAESNVGLVKGLFQGCPLQWHVPDAGMPLDAMAEEYQQQLQLAFPPDGVPCFDLVFLGSGGDGHVASLFPEDVLQEDDAVWVQPVRRSAGPHRITLTLPLLRASRRIMLVMAGAEKHPVAQRRRGRKGKALPVDHFLPEEGRVYWFLDAAADTGSC